MRTPIPTLGRLLALPAVALLAVLLVLAGCGSTSATGGTSPTATTAPTTAPTTVPTPTSSGSGGAQAAVTISGVSTYKFSPDTMSVKVGTTVTWTNSTQAPHTVTSDSGDPDSFNGSVDSGSTFTFTFTKPGTYKYHCNIHPYMTATITVTA